MKTRFYQAFCVLGGLLIGVATAHAETHESQEAHKFGAEELHQSGGSHETSTAVNDVIYFGFDSAVLEQMARQQLDQAVAWLHANPQREIMLEGHASAGGSVEHNQALSFQRARNAKEYIVSRGISASRVHVQALGEQFRISASDAANRRVVLYATRTEQSMLQPMLQPTPQAPAIVEVESPAGSGQAVARVEVVVNPAPATASVVMQHGEQVDEVDTEEILPGHERLIFPFGASVTLGGGVTGFFDSNTRAYTNMGGQWESRLTLGLHSPVAVETAYVGSIQGLNARGLDDDALLLGHSMEASVRLNVAHKALTQPYVFAGLGWTRYSVENTDTNTSIFADESEIAYVPAGIGLGLHWSNMVLDMRATARVSLYGELINPDMAIDDEAAPSNLNNWSINARLGWEL